MNFRFQEESKLIRDIQNLVGNSRIDDMSSIIPIRSNWYDSKLATLLGVKCNYEFTIDFIDAMDSVTLLNLCWVMFNYSTCDTHSRKNNHKFVEISQLLEAFGNAHFTSTSNVASMSCMELAVTIIWLETLTILNEDIFVKFESKMWLDSLVQGLIQILRDKTNDSTSQALAISALVFLIQHHKLESSILTETNLIQLLHLLLNKMVYPSSDTNLQIRDEFEASICRIGLYRMLKIENFKISEVIKNDIFLFIKKWWERILNNISDSNDASITFPIKYVLSVFSIMFEMLPFVKEYICNNYLRCSGMTLFQVLLHYIKSPDIRVSYIANSLLSKVLFELMRIDLFQIVDIHAELCNIEKAQRDELNILNNTWKQLISSTFELEQNVGIPQISILQPIISSIQQNLSIISSLDITENKKSLSFTTSENSLEREELIELKNRLFAMKTNSQMLQNENQAISDELRNINKVNESKLQVLIDENNLLRRKLSKAEDEVYNLKLQQNKAIQKNIINEGLIKDAWDKNGQLNELFNQSQESLVLYKHQAEVNKEKVVELESELLHLKLKISELQEYEGMVNDMKSIKKQLNDEVSERLKSDQLNQILQEKKSLLENQMNEQENTIKSLQIIVTKLTKVLDDEKRKLHNCEEEKENLKNNNIGLEDRLHKQLELIQTINKLSVVKNV